MKTGDSGLSQCGANRKINLVVMEPVHERNVHVVYYMNQLRVFLSYFTWWK